MGFAFSTHLTNWLKIDEQVGLLIASLERRGR